MLQLKDIVKTYVMGDTRVEALKNISLEFRKSDFVSILGPSGCGKTTLLNIIGGLDRYTSGDLVINGISTKEYKDVDWDIYRNNSIGFVFQSYNLISHQSVYSNVELALTLAGASAAERKQRVTEVLEKVGLGDQIYKKPTQISGGQMQRVAIARALVNNPDILLADEPTGALDSETSVQIMELLKEIAKERLVIMVTHNDTIAARYSTRIIKLLDGKVIGDTRPHKSEQEATAREKKRKKISMSFFTALSLSFKNLLTKKTRTILTAFAGSIGIIGIALILSLSDGMQNYISRLERDTMSTYPLSLESQTIDMSSMIISMMMSHRRSDDGEERVPDRVYSNNIMSNMIETMTSKINNNDLSKFKQYIESEDGKQFYEYVSAIQYRYNVALQVYSPNTSKDILQINPSTIFSSLGMGGLMGGSTGGSTGGMSMGMGNYELWSEMLGDEELLHSQYDVIVGDWPKAYNEIILVIDKDNELSDMALYSLGLLDRTELEELIKHALRGEEYQSSSGDASFSYEEILSLSFKLLLNTDYYVKEGDQWLDKREDVEYMKAAIENALELKVVGIVRPSENAAATSISGSIGYLSALTDYVIDEILKTAIAKEQLAKPETNVFTGMPFDMDDYLDNFTMDDVMEMISKMPEKEQAQMLAMLAMLPEEQIIKLAVEQLRASMEGSSVTYEENIVTLGIVDYEKPSIIRIYPKGFESKEQIKAFISDYNKMQEDFGHDEYVIRYTDIVGILTDSFSEIVNIISYVLIAFVAISLVVSSIMIAIITYISVLERTKEIGILRSIGASKKDITRVFNAETVIEGLIAGALGVLIAAILNIPVNAIIKWFAGISGLAALPLYGVVGLIAISVLLTVIAGFIPSKMAAKKDPVVALRTE